MKCVLRKKVNKVEKDNKVLRFTNYYLVFENGKKVRVCPEYLPIANVKDAEKVEKIKESNNYNALVMDLMADLDGQK